MQQAKNTHISSNRNIDFFLEQGTTIIDQDRLSPPAAKELIIGAVSGLVQDQKAIVRNVSEIWVALCQGQTVRIDNEKTGACMIFQVHRPQKRKH